MPLPPRLAEQLKSEIADLKNTGERWGGALTAGLFLKEFAGDVPGLTWTSPGPSSANKNKDTFPKAELDSRVASILNYLRRSAT